MDPGAVPGTSTNNTYGGVTDSTDDERQIG